MGGLGTRNNNPDQLQEDILAAMKDSGVLDEWKEKLDDMLYNDKEAEEDSQKKERKKLPVINDQEREMLRSFIDEYKSDGNLKISTELILNIVERVQKTPKPNLPQIFVQLGPVIDVVDAIARKTGDVEKIISRLPSDGINNINHRAKLDKNLRQIWLRGFLNSFHNVED